VGDYAYITNMVSQKAQKYVPKISEISHFGLMDVESRVSENEMMT